MGNDAVSQSAASSEVDLFPGGIWQAPRVYSAWWGMDEWLSLIRRQPGMQAPTGDGALPRKRLAAPEGFAFYPAVHRK